MQYSDKDLNITRLIEAAEELTGNGMLSMAEAGTFPVQDISIDGKLFQLELTAKLKPHPESVCQQCRKANVSWYADNYLWNKVMPDDGGILCPQCFEKKAKAKGLNIIFHCTEFKD